MSICSPPDFTKDEWWKEKAAWECIEWDGIERMMSEPAKPPLRILEEMLEEAKQYEESAKHDFEKYGKGKDDINEIAYLKAQIKVLELETVIAKEQKSRSTGRLESTKPGLSAIFPGKTMGGLKTRRRKHRNGFTRIFNYKTRHLFKRQKSPRD